MKRVVPTLIRGAGCTARRPLASTVYRRPGPACRAVAVALTGAAGVAQAALPDLPDASFLQTVNVGTTALSTTEHSSLGGTYDFTSGSTQINLGPNPTVHAAMQESASSAFQGTHGGSTSARLIYSVAFYNPGAGFGFLPVRVGAFDSLLAHATGYSASAISTSFLDISGWDVSRSFSHCAGQSTDGVDPCRGNNQTPIGDFSVNMRQNTVYTVMLNVTSQAVATADFRGNSNASASAVLDPSFSVLGGAPAGGSFIYSANVLAVPEPQTWALWLAGIGWLARRRKR